METGPLVLIADDDADFLRLAAWELDGCGITLRPARDGLDAALRLCDAAPALVIADIDMPGLDGIRLIRHVRAQPGLQDTKILAITGKGASFREEAIEAGADDFLPKPFEPETFRGTVLQLLLGK